MSAARSVSQKGGKKIDRGNYKCGRCGVPKKGHICPYHVKVKKDPDAPTSTMVDQDSQCELNEGGTLRLLDLNVQGYAVSYVVSKDDAKVASGINRHSKMPETVTMKKNTKKEEEEDAATQDDATASRNVAASGAGGVMADGSRVI